ncbi:MAG: TrkA family potassium uptake protein [Candidatus Omnitrophota bacterium]|nr:TrkA family potassium uptake protein [Candidatus Omnitrophota bacterium]MDZ4242180.1 TrkA family potassium uptake protein [Candidatus Omnitrophota bacterium]
MHIVIIGGGRIGMFLAKRLLKENHTLVIVEKEEERAQEIAKELDLLVIHGDACEPSILEQAGIERADVMVAATGKDEDNFIVCQIAKEQFKVKRTIARVNDPENERAFNELGVDVPIGATVILGKIIEEEASFADVVDLFSFKRGKLALIRVDLPENSPVIHKKLQELQFPANSVLVSIMRGDEIIVPKGDTTLQPMDDILALTFVEQKQQLLNFLIGNV